jgi:magnesium transporter
MTTRCVHFDGEGGTRELDGVPSALQSLGEPGFMWFDLRDPTMEELAPLGLALNLHPLSIEDCLDENQIPKLDTFPTYSFVLFNRYRLVDGELVISEVDVILGERFVITVHGRGGEEGALGNLEERLQRAMTSIQQGPAFLMHAILDLLVDGKFEIVEALQEGVDEAEEAVLRDPGPFDPERVLTIRRQLLELRRSLYFEREVLIKLCRRDSPYVPEKAIYPLRDVYDHLAKLFEIMEISREMITNVMDLHFAIQNNQLTVTANRTNRTITRLTVITTTFMPLTLLAGIGGMSEWSMMTGPENWPVAYSLFLLGMAVIGGLNILVLRWLKWI